MTQPAKYHEAADRLAVLATEIKAKLTIARRHGQANLSALMDAGDRLIREYLARLAAEATTIINAADYGRTVCDLSARRALISALRKHDPPPSMRRRSWAAMNASPHHIQVPLPHMPVGALRWVEGHVKSNEAIRGSPHDGSGGSTSNSRPRTRPMIGQAYSSISAGQNPTPRRPILSDAENRRRFASAS